MSFTGSPDVFANDKKVLREGDLGGLDNIGADLAAFYASLAQLQARLDDLQGQVEAIETGSQVPGDEDGDGINDEAMQNVNAALTEVKSILAKVLIADTSVANNKLVTEALEASASAFQQANEILAEGVNAAKQAAESAAAASNAAHLAALGVLEDTEAVRDETEVYRTESQTASATAVAAANTSTTAVTTAQAAAAQAVEEKELAVEARIDSQSAAAASQGYRNEALTYSTQAETYANTSQQVLIEVQAVRDLTALSEGTLSNPGFEFEKFMLGIKGRPPQGWAQGPSYAGVTQWAKLGYSPPSGEGEDVGYGSTTAFGYVNEDSPPWALSKSLRLQNATQLTVRTQVWFDLIALPPTITRNPATQTFIAGDDAALRITCYNAAGQQLAQTERARHSDTLSQLMYDGLGLTGNQETDNQNLEWVFDIPATTDIVMLELLAFGIASPAVSPLSALIASGASPRIRFDNLVVTTDGSLQDLTDGGIFALEQARAAIQAASEAESYANDSQSYATASQTSSINSEASRVAAGNHAASAAQSSTDAQGYADDAQSYSVISDQKQLIAQAYSDFSNYLDPAPDNSFTFDDDNQGWLNHSNTNAGWTAAGALRVTHVGANGTVKSPIAAFDGGKYNKIRARIKVLSGTLINLTGVRLGYTTAVRNTVGAHEMVPLAPTVITPDADGWVNLLWDVTKTSEWTEWGGAQIQQLFLKVSSSASFSYDLDYLYVLGEAADSPYKSAMASITSASEAEASASLADQRANASQTSAIAANTSAANALLSEQNSANSATSANGSAATATNQATISTNAATAAGNSATAAGNSATAAGISETNAAASVVTAQGAASTATTQAGISTSAATEAANTAVSLFPDNFAIGKSTYTDTATGNPTASLTTSKSLVADGSLGQSLQLSGIASTVYTKGVLQPVAGRVYQIEVRVRSTANPTDGNNNLGLGLVGLNSNYATPVSVTTTVVNTLTVAGGVAVYRAKFSNVADGPNGVAAWPAGKVWLRPFIAANNGESGSPIILLGMFKATDFTDQHEASKSAASANVSALSAATSKTDAESAAGTATTQAGIATTAATTAGNHSTNAGNSAAAAGVSESNAAGSATTATTAAGTATTQAGIATSAATTATNKAGEASTSAANASTSAGQAATSKTDAESAASAATMQAGIATTAATNAGGSATTAQRVADSLFPDSFTYGKESFTDSLTGSPTAVATTTKSTVVDGTLGPVLEVPGLSAVVATKGVVGVVNGRIYEVEIGGAVSTNPTDGNATLHIGMACLDNAFANATEVGTSFGSINVAGGRFVLRARFSNVADGTNGVVAWTAGKAWLRPRIRTNQGEAGSPVIRIQSFRVTDVTSSIASAVSAAAAAVSQSAAAGSATTADAAASTATTQAGISTTAATNSGNALAAARLAVQAIFPSNIASSKDSFTDATSGAPDVIATTTKSIVNDPTIGSSIEIPGNSVNFMTKGVLEPVPGRVYELEVTGIAVANPSDGQGTVRFYMLNLGGSYVYTSGATNFTATTTLTVAQGKFTYKRRFSDVADNTYGITAWPGGAIWLRPCITSNNTETGSPVIRYNSFKVSDVSQLVLAEKQAAAAGVSAGNASSSAAAASISESNSAGSATTAGTAAGTATTQAGIATSAATTATTQAGNASTSATNAQTALTNARNAVTAIFPSNVAANKDAFTDARTGAPTAVATTAKSIVTDPTIGDSLEMPLSTYIYTKGVLEPVVGRVYEIEITGIQTVNPTDGNGHLRIYLFSLSSTFTDLSSPGLVVATSTLTVAQGKFTYKARFGSTADSAYGITAWDPSAAGAAWLRPAFLANHAEAGAPIVRVNSFKVTDVTAVVLAERQANNATAVSAALFPDNFNAGKSHLISSGASTILSTPPSTVTETALSIVTDATLGGPALRVGPTSEIVATRGVLDGTVGRVYEIEVVGRIEANPTDGASAIQIGFAPLANDYTYTSGSASVSAYSKSVADGVFTLRSRFSDTADGTYGIQAWNSAGGKTIHRPYLYVHPGETGSPYALFRTIRVRDITSQINAERQAAAAAGSATTATTQAAAASISAGQAATSETNAATSAGTASTQAGIATSAATTATTQAGNASAASLATQQLLNTQFPPSFNSGKEHLGSSTNHIPGAPTAVTTTPFAVAYDGTLGGPALQITGADAVVSHKAVLPTTPGRVYELKVTARIVTNPTDGNGSIRIGLTPLDSSYAVQTNAVSTGYIARNVASGVFTNTFLVSDTADAPNGVVAWDSSGGRVYQRPFVQFHAGDTGAPVASMLSFSIRDVTEVINATKQVTLATTQAAAAGVSATQAAGSKTDAETAAATATTQAGISTTAASTSTTQANNAAASALASQLSNRNGPVLPYDFREGVIHWSDQRTGSPEASVTTAASLITNDADFGNAAEIAFNTAGHNFNTKGVVPAIAGRVYEVRVRFKASAAGVVSLTALCMSLNASYAQVALHTPALTPHPGDNSVAERVYRFSDTASSGVNAWNASAVWLRFGLRLNASIATTFRFGSLKVTDVTEVWQAENQVIAATTQAANASTSAGQAATSETNANAAAGTASTQAGIATGAASTATGAATTAQLTANSLFPDNFINGKEHIASASTGDPQTAVTTPRNLVDVPGFGRCLSVPGTDSQVLLKPVLPAINGRIYEIEVVGQAETNPTDGIGNVVVRMVSLIADYTNTGTSTVGNTLSNITVAGGTFSVKARFGYTADAPYGVGAWTNPGTAVWLRPYILVNNAEAGSPHIYLRNIFVRDVTGIVAAEKAAVSQSAAAASQAAAAINESNSAGSATTATTAAGTASTQAGIATSAATTATTQAGNAIATANSLFPDSFLFGKEHLTESWHTGSPSAVATAPQSIATDSDGTYLTVAGTAVRLSPKATMPYTPGRVYEIEVRFKATTNPTAGTGTADFHIAGLLPDYTGGSAFSKTMTTFTVAQGMRTFKQRYSDVADPARGILAWSTAGGRTQGRFLLRINNDEAGFPIVNLYQFSVKDVTAQVEAERQAAAALSSAGTATTQAAAASVSAGQAATSETNASTSAGTASTQAGIATSAATTATTQAGNAIATANSLFPDNFVSGKEQIMQTTTLAGQGGAPTVVTTTTLPIVVDGTMGPVLSANVIGARILHKGVVPAIAGRVYEVEAVLKVIANSGTGSNSTFVDFVSLNADYTYHSVNDSTVSHTVAQGEVKRTFRVSNTADAPRGIIAWPVGAVWLRPRIVANNASTGSPVTYIKSFKLTDITAQVEAERQAATATSQAAAASVSAGNAATSETNAAGSAATASTQAGISTTAATTTQNLSNSLFPDSFLFGKEHLTDSWHTGSPSAVATAPQSIATDADGTYLALVGTTVRTSPKATVPYTPGKVYELEVRFKATTNPTDGVGTMEIFIAGLLPDYTSGEAFNQVTRTFTVAQGMQTFKQRYSDVADPARGILAWSTASGRTQGRFLLRTNAGETGSPAVNLYQYSVKDVTSVVAAERQANNSAIQVTTITFTNGKSQISGGIPTQHIITGDPSLLPDTALEVVTDATLGGPVLRITGIATVVPLKTVLDGTVGRIYEVEVVGRIEVNPTDGVANSLIVGIGPLDTSYIYTGGTSAAINLPNTINKTVADGVWTGKWRFSDTADAPYGISAWNSAGGKTLHRLYLQPHAGEAGSPSTLIKSIKVTDVTAVVAAEKQAAAALTSAGTATTQAAAASLSASGAASSKTDAETAAATATTQAGISTSAATNAQQTVMATLPPATNSVENFTDAVTGVPNSMATTAKPVVVDPTVGGAIEVIGLDVGFAHKGVVAAVAGRVYELEITGIATVNPTDGAGLIRGYMYNLDASYAYTSGATFNAFVQNLTVAQGKFTYKLRFSDVADTLYGITAWAAGAVWLRPAVICNTSEAGSPAVRISSFKVTDITEQVAAEKQVVAANYLLNAQFPPDFTNGKNHLVFSAGRVAGAPTAIDASTTTYAIANDATLGGPALQVTNIGWPIQPKAVLPVVAGRVYEISVTARMTTNPTDGTGNLYIGMGTLDVNYAYVGSSSYNASVAKAVADGVFTLTARVSDTADAPRGVTAWTTAAGGIYLRPFIQPNLGEAGSPVMAILRYSVRDITDVVNAERQVALATTQAGTATTQAGISAAQAVIAANQQKLAAVATLAAQVGEVMPENMWNFTDGTVMGWVGSQATLSNVNNQLNIVTTGTDPIITKSGLQIEGAKYNKVVLRVRITAGTMPHALGNAWALYWATAGHGISGSYAAVPQEYSLISLTSGVYVTLVFDMSNPIVGGTDWITSIITNLRIDLGNVSGNTFQIDYIAVGAVSQSASVVNLTSQFPPNFTGGKNHLMQTTVLANQGGSPTTVPTTTLSLLGDATMGQVLNMNIADARVLHKSVLEAVAGRVYELEATFKVIANSGTGSNNTYLDIVSLNADYTYHSFINNFAAQTVANGEVTRKIRFSNVADANRNTLAWPAGAVWLRPRFIANTGSTGSPVTYLKTFKVTDITAQAEAEKQGILAQRAKLLASSLEMHPNNIYTFDNSNQSWTAANATIVANAGGYSVITSTGTSNPRWQRNLTGAEQFSGALWDKVIVRMYIAATTSNVFPSAPNLLYATVARPSASYSYTLRAVDWEYDVTPAGTWVTMLFDARDVNYRSGSFDWTSGSPITSLRIEPNFASAVAADIVINLDFIAVARENMAGPAVYSASASVQATNSANSATTASNASAAATASMVVAAKVGTGAGLTKNPVFADWTGTYPNFWALWNNTNSTVSKETALARYSGNAVRMTVTTASGAQVGIQSVGTTAATNALLFDNYEYVVVEAEVELVSGTIDGAGILLRWAGTSAYEAEGDVTALSCHKPIWKVSGVSNNIYSLKAVVRRSASFAGTWTRYHAYLMGGYNGFGIAVAVHDIIWHKFIVRPASDEEIRTRNVASEISAAVSVESGVRASAIGAVEGKYGVKVDVNGYVSGFGLISTANNAAPFSEFTIAADSFKVVKPGGAGGSATPKVMFTVGLVNGVSQLVMASGTVIATSIAVDNLAAINATLGSVDISNAVIGTLQVGTANIANLSVDGTKIADFAVSEPLLSDYPDDFTLSASSAAMTSGHTHVYTNGIIIGTCEVLFLTGDSKNVTITIEYKRTVDSTWKVLAQKDWITVLLYNPGPKNSFQFIVTPTDGTGTYEFRIRLNNNSGSESASIDRMVINTVYLKK